MVQQLVVEIIQKMCPDFSDDEIQSAVGILRTNGSRLESPPGHGKGLGLFPTYSMVNHSCLYNAITKKKSIDGVTTVKYFLAISITFVEQASLF